MLSFSVDRSRAHFNPPSDRDTARSIFGAGETALAVRQVGGNVESDESDSSAVVSRRSQVAGNTEGARETFDSPPTQVAGSTADARDTVLSPSAQVVRNFEGEDNTIAGIVDDYDYTRDPPYEHEETLRALESGSIASHDDDIFSQLSLEVQRHMSEQSSERLSELPTSERTYGDTNQLLGIGQRQTGPLPLPHGLGGHDMKARIRPAPGRTNTEVTIGSGPPSATGSVHSASSPFESSDEPIPERPRERARGDPHNKAPVRDISGNTFISDGEGDWETLRSGSHTQFSPGIPRPSEESYANTSYYSERNRLSAMSDAFPQPPRTFYSQRTGFPPRGLAINTQTNDVEKAKNALYKICKDKLPNQTTSAGSSGGRTIVGEPQRTRSGLFPGLRNRRAVDSAHDNDIELEELRKRNPEAVRLAANQVYEESVAEREAPLPRRSNMPLEKIRSVLKLPSANSRTNNYNMGADGHDDQRNLLARTPTTDDRRSRLEFSGTANTFRTVLDSPRTIRHVPSLSENESRSGLDLGERPFTPAMPEAVYTPEQRGGLRPHHNLESGSRARNKGKAPIRPGGRAAMSSQTSLRALITSGSPTSNIQGAFTDREMIEASHRWNLFPTRRPGTKRYQGSFPHFDHAAIPNSNAENRMLVHPSEIMHPTLLSLQDKLSKRYLMRMLPCPPLCFMYCSGHFDYLIARKTNGDVKTMASRSKDDALCYGVLVTICYVLVVVGFIVAAVVIRQHR